ncbi:MAG: 2OG-Fe(II) oxygenase family protein [Pseudomonadales bacterium]
MSDVPVISLRNLEDSAQALAQLDAACRQWGFFQIVDHGLDTGRIEALERAAHQFFALPRARKLEIERSADNVWGYFDRELTKNRQDWKQIFDFGPTDAGGPLAQSTAQWPRELPGFRAAVEAHFQDCERIALRLLDALASNLGVPPGTLRQAFLPAHTSFLRLNYYPVCRQPAAPDAPTVGVQGELGIHHHTDAGALTVLLQDSQPGLQVLHDGAWRLVQPLAGALTINIGDVVQVWSNDRYRAPLHRVLASARAERYSAAFFFNPSYAHDYAPVPGCCDADHPPRYRPINWGEFRAGRAAGDYADYGEEIQIEHFQVA